MKIKLLTFEEGYRKKPYYCTKKYPTVGIGKRIGGHNSALSNFQFTVPLPVAQLWLECDLVELETKLNKFDWFKRQNTDRQAILISMAYQLGYAGLMDFKKMIRALNVDDYDKAYTEALDSKWYKSDTPVRAMRHAQVLRAGKLKPVYDPIW